MRRVWVKVVAGFAMVCLPSGLLFAQQPDAFESFLASAQQAQARGDFQAAAEFYQRALAIHPEIPELKANVGLMYYQLGDIDNAVEFFHQALRLKPDLFVPNLFLGLVDVKTKRFKEAIPYLKKAVISKPTDIQAQEGLGQAYSGIGEPRLAIRSYRRATELDSRHAEGWYRLGISYLEQVEADARTLLAEYKGSPYLQALMGDNFRDQGALIQAAEAYRKALNFPSVPAGMRSSYGFVLVSQHDLSGAGREFKAELSANPGSLGAWLGMARLSFERGAHQEMVAGIERVWSADAGFFKTNTTRLTSGMSAAKRAELLQVLEQSNAKGDLPEDVLVLFRGEPVNEHTPQQSMGKASGARDGSSTLPAQQLYTSGKYGECAGGLASRPQPLPAAELRLLTTCAYLSGNTGQAFDAAGKLVSNGTNHAEALYWEVKSAQKLATDALGQASEIDSSSPKMHVLLGDVFRQRKYFPDAEQEYRKALALQPNDVGALFGLSLALLADEQIEDAFGVAQAALKNSPIDPELNAVMGEILCARGDFSGAEPYLKKSLNTKPEYVSHVHALLGKVYAQMDRTDEAIAELKLALPDDKDGRLHYQIARLYLKVRNRDAANQAFKTSNRLRGENLNRAAVSMRQGEGANDAP